MVVCRTMSSEEMVIRKIQRGVGLLAPLTIAIAAAGCHGQSETSAGNASPPPIGPRAEPARPIVDDGQWRMAAKDHANLRFSTLAEIDTRNVGSLKVAWTFSTGVLRGHEAPPLV